MIANTTATHLATEPTTVLAIVAFSEGCWKELVSDDVNVVNIDRACVAGVPARVGEGVEADVVDRELAVNNDIDDDEALATIQLKSEDVVIRAI